MAEPTQRKKKKVSSVQAIAMSAMDGLGELIEKNKAKQVEVDEKFKGLYLKETERHEKSKKQIIQEFAEATAKTGSMSTGSICKHICEVLKEFANKTYIVDSLDSKYKNESMANNRAGSDNRTNTKKGKKDKEPKLTKEEEKVEAFKAAQEQQAAQQEAELDTRTDSDQIWNIDPSTYDIKDLPDYDFAFRGRLIEYLHEDRQELRTENQKLKKRLTELEKELKQ